MARDGSARAGGGALPIVGDIRDEESVLSAVDRTVLEFGGVDVVVDNAGAIDLSSSVSLSMKRFDLMQQVNARMRSCAREPACPTSSPAPIPTYSPTSPRSRSPWSSRTSAMQRKRGGGPGAMREAPASPLHHYLRLDSNSSISAAIRSRVAGNSAATTSQTRLRSTPR